MNDSASSGSSSPSSSNADFLKSGSAFCIQAVSGMWMALIKMHYNQDDKSSTALSTVIAHIAKDSSNVLENLLVKYLNDCWHSFHKKDDKYVEGQITKMLSHNILKHPSCLFGFLHHRCSALLRFSIIGINQGYLGVHGYDLNVIRTMFQQGLLKKIDDDMVSQPQSDISCNKDCKPCDYDGKDVLYSV